MRVSIRVRPGASREYVGGTYGDGAIVVRVCAPAVDGRATEAALKAVASAFGVRRGDVRLVSGATARDKVVEIAGDEEELARRAARLREG
ncbi:hypothetical protein TBS_03990 [Thermobispora bispora]|uniref:UPF0235 protein Tbis_1417 n=1 Tax=Thermobispora bispora (strain ATCC 19993 / DSM 43833 / CBS 139.67 / JCM 10125 / KCTC 9307 / NBRC 14880 / R51) TaxID=469371 RepID=D6Y9Z2_THEBD|nr:DUF167 domain-containing protein [Thermobispora bispora]MBO2474035.1 DUF167 domain-containing protein [Actinomycetales bacterium]MDI9582371.1 DUF167 domain-containing protein [Thermobispora sp.]ADG88135.1 protein of unknown function DUF167 [Thermobispora bispora DSM 43833]MBX6168359.1 DUF167 domain-containing protein [Thermobispora bispora]QSI47988.1 DUF167 domain-containing protein [Thermobispora bispora]